MSEIIEYEPVKRSDGGSVRMWLIIAGVVLVGLLWMSADSKRIQREARAREAAAAAEARRAKAEREILYKLQTIESQTELVERAALNAKRAEKGYEIKK